jgi:hypothetical protein
MRMATIACIVEGHGEVQALPLLRAAKEWLGAKRVGRPYKETSDQAAFTAVFDMKAAREKSPSFDKFWREAERLLRG